MVNFSNVLLAIFALLISSTGRVLGEGSGDSKALIGGSGNGEIIDGSGSGESLEETEILPPECTGEFRGQKDHTMCKYFDDARVRQSGVSDADKKIIVDLHNQLRSQVDPPATDLSKLLWDDKLASVADKWAKQCIIGHDKNRKIPSYGMTIGQNAAAGFADWTGAIMAWYNEVRFFKYGEDPDSYLGAGGWKKVGHYTQVVQASSSRVGCGFANCSSSEYATYYVCNYAKGQTYISTPYTKGDRCSTCPNSCKDGLCDCGGKLCRNGGILDQDSCTCKCLRIYTGESCETLSCPASDKSKCWNTVYPKHCKVDWVKGDCPYMCGICGGPEGATPPPEFVSKHNCTYKGQRPSAAMCAAYGDNGADKSFCQTRGGQYGCTDCIKYNNVKSDYCPVMCGMCDGPCNGKICKNGGELNRETCDCECDVPYVGENCETAHCPDTLKDGSSCWSKLMPPDCEKYSNVPSMCPWMCGLCGPEGATPPPVHTSAFGCTYTGQRPSKDECATYGSNGADSWACASQGGQFNCAHCLRFGNVKREYCPVMCGYCEQTQVSMPLHLVSQTDEMQRHRNLGLCTTKNLEEMDTSFIGLRGSPNL